MFLPKNIYVELTGIFKAKATRKIYPRRLKGILGEFSDAIAPGDCVGDVLGKITSDRVQRRRYDIAISILSRTLPDARASLDQVQDVTVSGHYDENGDAADVFIDVRFKKDQE